MRLGGIFDIENKLIRIDEEEQKTQAPNFWNDPSEAEKQLKYIASLKEWTTAFKIIETQINELKLAIDFYKDGEIEESEVENQYKSVIAIVENLELKNMLRKEEDKLGAYLQIN